MFIRSNIRILRTPSSLATRCRHFHDKAPPSGMSTNMIISSTSRLSERTILETAVPESIMEAAKPIHAKKYDSTGNSGDHKNKDGKKPTLEDSPPPVPRRLIVKRRVGVEDSTKSANTVGLITGTPRRRKKKLSEKDPVEVFDTLGQPILEVPRKPKSGLLPVLNASSLLHTKSYCVKSAKNSTKSGTAAARRLLRGQHDFLQVVRKLVPVQHKFLLKGHGVPSQLLEEHIHLANDVLSYYNDAVACSFHSLSDSVERIRIRTEGGNQVASWPPKASRLEYSWDESLQLYLKVMQRMAKRLGDVLISPPIKENTHEPSATWTKDEYDNEFDSVFLSSSTKPHHWNVEFARLSQSYDILPEPVITVEFTPILYGPSAPGHVRLQLRGQPKSASSASIKNGVVMSVDAAFRWKANDGNI